MFLGQAASRRSQPIRFPDKAGLTRHGAGGGWQVDYPIHFVYSLLTRRITLPNSDFSDKNRFHRGTSSIADPVATIRRSGATVAAVCPWSTWAGAPKEAFTSCSSVFTAWKVPLGSENGFSCSETYGWPGVVGR
jgi:hypothetical protein